MDGWWQILKSGHLELPLAEMTLSRVDGATYKGSGRLIWEWERGLTLEAMVDAEGDFLESMSYNEMPGKLISRDRLYKLSGIAANGCRVEADAIIGAQSSFDLSPYKIWREKINEARIISAEPYCEVNIISALLQPVKVVNFTRASEVADDNPHFSSSWRGMDWLEFENNLGHVAARKIGDGRAQVSLVGDHGIDTIWDAMESVRLAFGFIEGRNPELFGYEAICNKEKHQVLLSGRATSHGAFPTPLFQSHAPCEDILRISSAFFHTAMGRKFSHYLRMCWNVCDNMGTVGAIIASVAVEAMVRLLAEEFGKGRFDGQVVIKHALKNWAERGVMGIVDAEAKAWEKVRNSATHGNMLFLDPDISAMQKNYTRRKLVENLVNKLTLQAMGYNGGFFDYSKHLPSHFISHDPDDLFVRIPSSSRTPDILPPAD